MSELAYTPEYEARYDKTMLGFWMYLMTDLVLFASLFATYIVLVHGTAGGPGPRELFSLPYALVETGLLLTSSYTSGLAMLALRAGRKRLMIGLLIATFLLGVGFLSMELHEFTGLVHDGHSWRSSAFLSGFFTLVATHGAHITVGLIWLSVLLVRLTKKGITPQLTRQTAMFSLFWHFLDVVWIFVFTVVYLMGGSILMARQNELIHGNVTDYTVGFGLSLLLTGAAYLLASRAVFAGWALLFALMGLALVQLSVQLVFFLHLGRGASGAWSVATFWFMALTIVIVVIGSLWIMHNLNYNMMPGSPGYAKRLKDLQGGGF